MIRIGDNKLVFTNVTQIYQSNVSSPAVSDDVGARSDTAQNNLFKSFLE